MSGGWTTDNDPDVGKKGKKRKKRNQEVFSKLKDVVDVNEILSYFKVDPKFNWDAVVIGDGSANTWHKEAGWASVLLEKEEIRPQVFFGGMSNGTNIVAELMAILQPLIFIKSTRSTVKQHGYRVVVLSDCQHVVDTLNSLDMPKVLSMANNRALWMCTLDLLRTGLSVKAVHMPRNSLPAALFSHNSANASRISMQHLVKQIVDEGRTTLE